MKTVNRGWLKRKVAAGEMEAKLSYSFDDMYGSERGTEWKPARLRVAGEVPPEGLVSFFPFDFESKSGRAYYADAGETVIHLRIHSNLSYDLRLKGKA